MFRGACDAPQRIVPYGQARGLRECSAAGEQLEGVRVVSVMDREADLFELFDLHRRLATVELLASAKHNRRLGKRVPKLFDGLPTGHLGPRRKCQSAAAAQVCPTP